jgi:hypothetical protein
LQPASEQRRANTYTNVPIDSARRYERAPDPGKGTEHGAGGWGGFSFFFFFHHDVTNTIFWAALFASEIIERKIRIRDKGYGNGT